MTTSAYLPSIMHLKAVNFIRCIGFFLFALATPTFAQPPMACNCLWQGAFSKLTEKADLIVTGTVVASKGNSIDIEISNTLLDKEIIQKEFSSVIRVWGDNGKLCRPTIDQFPQNSQWLMGLKKITQIPDNGFNPNTPNISFGRVKDYYLSSCGAYWLKLQDGHVSGPLVKTQRWQWSNEMMNPVLLELVDAYINGVIPEQALVEAAKPLTEAKKLMEKTKHFLRQQ